RPHSLHRQKRCGGEIHAEHRAGEEDFRQPLQAASADRGRIEGGADQGSEGVDARMNRNVNAIAGRLSLRPPQRHSLDILDRITEIVPPNKAAELAAALEIIRSEYPTVTDVEREVPSVCCALT